MRQSTECDEEVIKTLGRFFGSLILHEITPHRIDQFKRDRLAGKWRTHRQKRAVKAVNPATAGAPPAAEHDYTVDARSR